MRLNDVLNKKAIQPINIVYPNSFDIGDLQHLCNDHEFAFFYLDGRNINSKNQLLALLAKEMEFPDYFGMNWGALKDCLIDFSWFQAEGYIIYFSNPEYLISSSFSDFKTFLEILVTCFKFWDSIRNKKFLVFLELEERGSKIEDFIEYLTHSKNEN